MTRGAREGQRNQYHLVARSGLALIVICVSWEGVGGQLDKAYVTGIGIPGFIQVDAY